MRIQKIAQIKMILALFLVAFDVLLGIGQPVDEFIRLANEYNPGLKALRFEYEAALLKAEQVNDWPDPKVNLGIAVLPVETRLGAQRFKIGISQMIPWKGSLNAKSDVAKSIAEIKSNLNEIKAIDIEFAIRIAYSTLQFLEENKTVVEQRLEVLDALEELSKSAVRAGKGKLSNALFIERKREFLNADIGLLNKKIEQPTIQINKWIGRAFDSKIEIFKGDKINIDKEAVLNYATNGHPQFEMMNNQIIASNSKIKLTALQAKPKLGLGIDYSFIDARSDLEIPDNGRDVLMPMGSIIIPLHKGKYNAIKQEESINQRAIQAKREEAEDSYLAEVELAFSVIDYENQVIAKYESLRNITKETLKLMRTEYAAEGTRFEELLRLEMELIDYDLEILKATYEIDLAISVLNKFN